MRTQESNIRNWSGDSFSYLLKPFDSLKNIGRQQHSFNALGSVREVLLSCAHVVPMAFTSASVLLRQVCFGVPTFRFACGFQARACLVTFEGDFLSVWPIQPHFLFLISASMGLRLVLSQRSVLEMTSAHLMMFLRHLVFTTT